MREDVMTLTCQRKILRTIVTAATKQKGGQRINSDPRHHTDSPHQFVRAHHLVVFMLEVMAVPDVFPWLAVEARDDARHHARIAAHGVFPTGFMRRRWYRGPGELQFLAGVPRIEIERTALDDLEAHKMQMDG